MTALTKPTNDFERSIGAVLKENGYEVVPQVGVAGFFIDLGVKHPAKAGHLPARHRMRRRELSFRPFGPRPRPPAAGDPGKARLENPSGLVDRLVQEP